MADNDNNRSLIPLPGASLAIARPEEGRVLSEMIGDTLALARQVPLFKIGEYEWCEPDYRQILLWATALALEPEEVIRRLVDRRTLHRPQMDSRVYQETVFENGRIVKLNWDFDLLPCADFQWVDGLEIEYLRVAAELPMSPNDYWKVRLIKYEGGNRRLPSRITSFKLSLPKLRTLICSWLLLDELDLSHLPCLEILDCSQNRLTELDLSCVPRLRELDCSHNMFRYLQGIGYEVLELSRLNCSSNLIDIIGFYDDQNLEHLEHVDIFGNCLETIDIRPLPNLKFLEGLKQRENEFGSHSCRVVLRPEQNGKVYISDD